MLPGIFTGIPEASKRATKPPETVNRWVCAISPLLGPLSGPCRGPREAILELPRRRRGRRSMRRRAGEEGWWEQKKWAVNFVVNFVVNFG